MKKHVLIIDDNADLLMMLTAILTSRGYTVVVSETAENIVNVIKDANPDMIMMDMLLSGADGRDLCRIVKSDASICHIPLIMLSAYPQAVTDCMAAGANAFIEKPFDMKALLNTLESLQAV